MRGHNLGRLLTQGSAAPNTGVPGDVGGYTTQRIIRAPADGAFEPLAAIGQRVEGRQQPVARVAPDNLRLQLTRRGVGMPSRRAVTLGAPKAGTSTPGAGRSTASPSLTRPGPSAAACWRGFCTSEGGRDYGASDPLRRRHVSLEVAHIAQRLEFELPVIDDLQVASRSASP